MLTKDREAEIRRIACSGTKDAIAVRRRELSEALAALDAERQTVAKLRDRIEKLREATITLADISFEQSPWGRLMRDAITEDDRLTKENP